MITKLKKENIKVSKKRVAKSGGVVILPLKEYEDLKKRAIPEYYLTGKEAGKIDKLVKEGLKEYEQGKCKTIKSLADLD